VTTIIININNCMVNLFLKEVKWRIIVYKEIGRESRFISLLL